MAAVVGMRFSSGQEQAINRLVQAPLLPVALPSQSQIEFVNDAVGAVKIALHSTVPHLIRSWVLTPVTLAFVLCVCAAVDALLRLPHGDRHEAAVTAAFPASVLVMSLLFAVLVAVEESTLISRKWKRRVVKAVEVPAGFGLRWINVFFTTSFVRLPMSLGKGEGIGGMSGWEVGVVVGVFLVGYAVTFVVTAYFVMGVQLVVGSGKRAEREDAISSTEEQEDETGIQDPEDAGGDISFATSNTTTSSITTHNPAESPSPLTLSALLPIAVPSRLRGPGPSPPTPDESIELTALLTLETHTSRPCTRPELWSRHLITHIDTLTYTFFFLLIGLPIYLTTGNPLFAHLPLTVLCYFFAVSLPPKITRILHPVLCCSLLTILGIWFLSFMQSGWASPGALSRGLAGYSRGSKYLDWLRSTKSNPIPTPGAGDVFSTLLDISIVALALPMFTYRSTLKTHFFPLLLPILLLLPLSLLVYPYVTHRLGLPPTLALSFPFRSLTLALATPAVASVGGNGDLTAVLCITSGIFGVLIGRGGLRMVGVKEEDYVTRGVVLGTGSAAIATAWLVEWDPRSAAMGSLSMVLFGTGMVVLTAVPAVVEGLRGMVGL